jgi:hypothetical protein
MICNAFVESQGKLDWIAGLLEEDAPVVGPFYSSTFAIRSFFLLAGISAND